MISFFTSLRRPAGTLAVQQSNALRSWRAAVPDCEIIVFDDFTEGTGLLTEVKATYRPEIACNEFGTPLISAMFAVAQHVGRHSKLCYINGDIILLPDFAVAMRRLAGWRTFCAVSRRWDLDWTEPVDFAKRGWDDQLRAAVAAHGQQHGYLGMDVIAFRRDAIGPLPEFAIGRPAWDNYLIKYLLKRRVPIVDMSAVVRPIHQNHDYAHVAERKGSAWEGPEADRNRSLAVHEFRHFNPRYYSIMNAQWVMLERRIVPALAPQRVLWRTLGKFIPDSLRDVANNCLYLLRNLSRALPKVARFWELYLSVFPYSFLPRNSSNVVVIRVGDVADLASWLDGARALQGRYPHTAYRLTLVAPFVWKATAEASGLFDEVIAIDEARFNVDSKVRKSTYRRLAKRRFAVAINPIRPRDPWLDNFIMYATGASVRVGCANPLDGGSSQFVQRITNAWYTQFIRRAEQSMATDDWELVEPLIASICRVRSSGD